ncbi:RNA polymerase sigma factor [Aquimarina rhabdastrellae]
MQSEDPFIKALLQGDEIVIEEIYNRFFTKTLRFVLQNKGTHDEAKDIFQEALLAIIVAVQKRNLNINSFEAYLMTVSKNMWRRELEKKKKRVIKDGSATLIDNDNDFALFILEQEQMQLYREMFHKLSDNCKEVLSLFFNNVSYESIVRELGYANINTARQRIFKCKSKLIKLIKSDIRFK